MKIGPDVAKELAATAEGLSAQNLLALVAARFPGRVALASSFSVEDQVVTDMLQRVSLPVAVFTLDTGRLPQETHDVIDATRERYGISIEVLSPDAAELEAMVRQHGTNLFYNGVESRRLCCQVRKVHPLRRKLAQLDAWICGLRREQATTRGEIQRVEWDAGNGLLKINPLAPACSPPWQRQCRCRTAKRRRNRARVRIVPECSRMSPNSAQGTGGNAKFTWRRYACPRAVTDQPRFLGRIEPPESNPRRPSRSRRGWLRVMCQRTRPASSRVYWLNDRRVETFIRSTKRL